jgi:murein DD-endopeptidase MepM/ murein hydrolase activator NlpD
MPGREYFKGMKFIEMRLLTFYFLTIFLTLTTQVPAFSDDSPISLSSGKIDQGGVIFVRITKTGNDEPELRWMKKEIFLFNPPGSKIYKGFIAADLEQKPGTYNLNLTFRPSDIEEQIKIKIVSKDYGVRKLTLPDNQVNLNKKDLARATKESTIMNKLWGASIMPPLWDAPFIMPLDSEVIGSFGRRSIINGQPRSPHTGVDMRGKKGTPVKAANNGLVVLTGNHFFTGNTVVIDHGAGIMSMYFHLDKINVKKGDKISRGEVLGTVGSTGRVTGPHLHWGVRIYGQRVDPANLVEISNKLEE